MPIKYRVVFLTGPVASGKTTTVNYFLKYVRERKGYDSYLYKDLTNHKTTNRLVPTVLGHTEIEHIPSETRDKRMMVVLDNCDEMLENKMKNFQKLMSEFCSKTKFCFLVTVMKDEILDNRVKNFFETTIKTPTLSIPSAVKLFLERARSKLVVHDRDPSKIAEHPLFKEHKYYPGDIINMTSDLANNVTLGEVQTVIKQKRLMERQDSFPESVAEIEYKEEIIELMNEDPSIIVFLSFLSCFQNGIYLEDLIELFKIDPIIDLEALPEDWLSPLFKLSLLPSTDKTEEQIEDLDDFICNTLMQTDDMRKVVSTFMDYHSSSSHHNFVTIKNTRIDSRDVCIVIPNKRILSSLIELSEVYSLIFDGLMIAIMFHRILLTTMIDIAKRRNFCFEELIEFSSVSEGILWHPTNLNSIRISYLMEKEGEISLHTLKIILMHYNTNYRWMLTGDSIFSFRGCLSYTLNEHQRKYFGDYLVSIEDLLVKILTVNKICEGIFESQEYVGHIKALFKEGSIRKELLQLNFKAEMYQAGCYIKSIMTKHESRITKEDRLRLWETVDTVEKLLKEIEPEIGDTPYLSSFYLLKWFTSKYDSTSTRADANPEASIKSLLGKLDDLEDYEHDWAMINLNLLQQNQLNSFNIIKVKEIDRLKQIIHIFGVTNSKKLMLQAKLLLCQRLRKDRFEECLKVAKKGELLASQNELIILRNDFQEIIKQVDEEISYRYQNKFVFLWANRLNAVPSPPETQIEGLIRKNKFLRADSSASDYPMNQPKIDKKLRIEKKVEEDPRSCMRFWRDYRLYLKDALAETRKKLVVEYGAAKKEDFINLFKKNEGCKLLVLDFCVTSDEGLVFEDEEFNPVVLTKTELEELQNNPDNDLNVDILVIMNRNAKKKVVPYFANTNTKYIVYFDLPDPAQQDEMQPRFLFDYFNEELKFCFLQEFIKTFATSPGTFNEIVEARTQAIEKVMHLKERVCTFYRVKYDSYNKGDSTKLDYDSQKDSLSYSRENIVILKNDQTKEGALPLALMPGEIIESAKQLWLKDGTQSFPPPVHISRDQEMKELMKLVSKKKIINIYGEPGIGKTFVAKELATIITFTKLFKDGVYLFNLNKVAPNKDIRELLKEQLGEDYSSSSEQNFLQNKDMLFIFDSFDRILSGRLMSPNLLFKTLHQNQIPIIYFTSSQVELSKTLDFETFAYPLRKFSLHQTLSYLLSCVVPSLTFFSLDNQAFRKLSFSDSLKKASGKLTFVEKRSQRILRQELGLETEAGLSFGSVPWGSGYSLGGAPSRQKPLSYQSPHSEDFLGSELGSDMSDSSPRHGPTFSSALSAGFPSSFVPSDSKKKEYGIEKLSKATHQDKTEKKRAKKRKKHKK